ncbi:cupin [Ancylobacter sp. 6x-1]|uniref:Cupin n=1 Tax=Ancylobacter crimeensis TaxID=2579147 RepID=A0ABT0D9Z0_9HYPH|nr:cupin [Ancylobacter crimeensis]MCK0196773.1 cupin [Ancylobacter crimeensis]
MPVPETLHFAPSHGVPNNPRLPVLYYRTVLIGTPATIESLIQANGWEPRWRNGVYDFHHFHSTAHEALAVAHGTASVMLGGEDGMVLDIGPGDILILPAGTGHKRITASDDFLLIGAYPPGQDYQIERPDAGRPDAALARIAVVPLPDSDPVTGRDGALPALWRAATDKPA